MIIQRYQINVTVLCVVLSLASYTMAEEINLSDENVAKNLLENKSLHCMMKETNYNGPIKIDINSINGNKFKGISEEWCHQTLTWSGKFKKNKARITQHGASAQTCYCRQGSLTFSRNSEGELVAKGHYGVACGATPFRGQLECVVK